MSATENALWRVGQLGTLIKLTLEEPDGITPGTFIPVDLTNKDAVGIEFERSNTTKFLFVDKAGDPDLVPTPSTITITDATNGKFEFKDKIGIFNVSGPWKYRGVYRESTGGVIEDFPGSWIERTVGV